MPPRKSSIPSSTAIAIHPAEVFDAVLRALAVTGETEGVDLNLHDSVTRRLAWGDSEEVVLADAEMVFDRLMVAIERFRAPERG